MAAKYHADPEAAKALRRAQRDPEKTREYNQRYYAENSEDIKARVAAWKRENPGRAWATESKRRALKAKSVAHHTAAEWQAIVKRQRGKCARCGQVAKLTKDHIVALSRGGDDSARNLQGLCRPCNSRKHNRSA